MEISIDCICKETEAAESGEKKKPAHKGGRWWHIDREMVLFKLHFFLMSGAVGAVLPFVGVFAKTRLRLSATSFASIMTVQQFLFVFTKPAVGFITDYFNKLKVILLVLTIVQAGILFLLLLVPPLPKGLYAVYGNSSTGEACNSCNNRNGSMSYTVKIEDIFPTEINRTSDVSDQMPSECDPFINRVNKNHSNTVDSDLSDERFFSNLFESPVNFTSCNPISSTSCAVSLRNQFLCCNRNEGCFYIFKDSEDTDKRIAPTSDFATYQFWVFAILFVSLNACINSIFTLSDTACCESVEKTGADFGKQRLWGCIGWGIFAPLGGFLNDSTGSYVATWILFVILSTLSLWNIMKLSIVKPHISKHVMKDIGTVVSSWEFICFEAGILLSGIGLGFTFFYLLWFITSIGGSSLLCGLIQTVQSFSGDIPFMFFSGWMLRKLGYFNIVTLSLVACSVRFLWYSQLVDPWIVLPIEWTHGVTYGLLYAAMASFGKMRAKPGTEATTQSVIFATFDGLGSGIGNIVAGVGFDYVGGSTVFLCTGTFFGCTAVLNFIGTLLARNRMKQSKKIKARHTSVTQLLNLY